LHNVDPSDVKEYLKEFLDFALDYVPKEQHHRTPIALLATAGMRIIPRARSSDIIDQVKLNLNSTGFYFDKTYGAIVIPGEYEGVFGWLATNYLSNNLNHHDEHFNRHDGDEHRISRAYFDMGGASTQITFEPNFMPYEHSFPINVNGTSRVVYTHSFLTFGRNEARKRYWNLIGAKSNGTTFEDPCLAGLLKHDAVIDEEVRTATGTGDFSECLKLTANLVNEEAECFYSECTIYGIHLSPIPDSMELYFTANFFDTANFFELSGEQTLGKLLEKVPEICDLNKFQFLGKYNKRKFQRDKDFYYYCFNMAYYINLLTYGYHVAPDRKIVFTETVEETDISWTLGAMIYEVHLLYPSGQCCDDWNDFRYEHPLVKKTNKKQRPMLI
jgi:Golgi nucleoside diphosphatase